ncbi:hypothetical protein SSPIM334S_03986 [Streptomyces spiroverticillatus]|uniref:FtsX-like permease family protein n=1 Tax=Streptomyces finlayi TaxID=67296 RepID=UPI001677E1AB|nr:FtsX-like permease family protein [Streptomyces finlayi]
MRWARHHALVLGAASVAVLLAATVLAALAALTERAVESGVQRRIAADQGAAVSVLGNRPGEIPAGVDARRDAAVRAAFGQTFAGVAHRTWSVLRAPAGFQSEFGVIDGSGQERDDVTVAVEVPVLAGPELRQGGTYRTQVRGVDLRLRVVGPVPSGAVRDDALGPVRGESAAPLVLADTAALGPLGPRTAGRSALLLFGSHLDAPVLRSLVPRAADTSALGTLRVRAEEEASIDSDGLLAALTTAYRLCTVLTVLLALIALVLDLLLSAPERGRTAARLRTMGLGDRATGALNLVQLLPMVAAAAIGGSALGLLLPGLLGDALDLRGFTGGALDPELRTDYAAFALLGGGFLLLVAAAVAVETALARRRKLGAVLRLGEQT